MRRIMLFFSLLIIMMTGGCLNDETVEPIHSNEQFLSLPEGINFSSLSSREELILKNALSRIVVKKDSYGILHLYPSSAKEANISEQIYERIKIQAERYNQSLLSGDLKTRSVFYSDGENNWSDYDIVYGTDCVAHAIAGALPNLSYVEVNYWIVQVYGNMGVPCKSIHNVMSHYGSNHPVDFNYQGEIQRAIGIIPNGNGGFHAVNILRISGDNVDYRDNQAAYEHTSKVEGSCKRINCQIYKYD